MSGVTKREAEQYRRLAAMADRAEKISARFEALGFDVPTSVAVVDLSLEQAEAILDRLEGVRATLDLDEGDRFKLRRIERVLGET